MDQHFLNAPMKENIPIIMGLLGVWNSSFMGYNSRALIPYAQALLRLPAHIQQLDMEVSSWLYICLIICLNLKTHSCWMPLTQILSVKWKENKQTWSRNRLSCWRGWLWWAWNQQPTFLLPTHSSGADYTSGFPWLCSESARPFDGQWKLIITRWANGQLLCTTWCIGQWEDGRWGTGWGLPRGTSVAQSVRWQSS